MAHPTQQLVILAVALFPALPNVNWYQAGECCRGLRIMRVAFASAAVFLSLCVAGQALAATVNATGGKVLINRGEGYSMVAGSAPGNAGDTIVVNRKCANRLSGRMCGRRHAGQRGAIAAQSPCASNSRVGDNGCDWDTGDWDKRRRCLRSAPWP